MHGSQMERIVRVTEAARDKSVSYWRQHTCPSAALFGFVHLRPMHIHKRQSMKRPIQEKTENGWHFRREPMPHRASFTTTSWPKWFYTNKQTTKCMEYWISANALRSTGQRGPTQHNTIRHMLVTTAVGELVVAQMMTNVRSRPLNEFQNNFYPTKLTRLNVAQSPLSKYECECACGLVFSTSPRFRWKYSARFHLRWSSEQYMSQHLTCYIYGILAGISIILFMFLCHP